MAPIKPLLPYKAPVSNEIEAIYAKASKASTEAEFLSLLKKPSNLTYAHRPSQPKLSSPKLHKKLKPKSPRPHQPGNYEVKVDGSGTVRITDKPNAAQKFAHEIGYLSKFVGVAKGKMAVALAKAWNP